MDLHDVRIAKLASMPWELLCREGESPLLVSSPATFVRAVDTPKSVASRPFVSPLRILALMSSPKNASWLDLEKEKTELEKCWGSLHGIEVDFVPNPHKQKVLDLIARNQYHIIHYMGHGDYNDELGGHLVLENRNGSADLINGEVFASWLKNAPLRLVFLNGCKTGSSDEKGGIHPFAGVATALVRAGVPAVVAMQHAISDSAAIEFARTFYDRISQAFPVDAAVAEGRTALYSTTHSEWATPVLYMRDADGLIDGLDVTSRIPEKPQENAEAGQTEMRSNEQPLRAADEVSAGPADVGKRSFGLADFKKKNQARQIFQFSLPKHELQDTQAISDFVSDFLDSYKLIDNVKAATVWISNELLRNAFLHGNFHDEAEVYLTLSSTSGGVSIRVAQPDDQGFDLARILDDPEKSDSFLQMISRRGLRIQIARISGRLEIAVELPSNLGLNLTPVDRASVGSGLPADVSRFVSRMIDICVHEHVVMARCCFLTVDESNSGSFETWLRDHISMIERHKGVVVVDLADVLYLPSLGLRELSKALREARKRKVDIVLAGASVELRQIFRISNYDKLFRIFDDSEAAFRSLSESA
jgi:anti-anti-sigma factor